MAGFASLIAKKGLDRRKKKSKKKDDKNNNDKDMKNGDKKKEKSNEFSNFFQSKIDRITSKFGNQGVLTAEERKELEKLKKKKGTK